MQHLFLRGTVTVLLLLLVTSLVLGAASVPNLVNFQGRLTDGSGNPVADGSHTVNFTLWTLPVGGSTVWTENTSQTTSSGLFTHNLGSITVLPATLFQTHDSLYLQVQADGQTILPRIRLTSTPYTRVSNILETDNTISPGDLAFESVPTGLFRTFGDDGLEQIRLWGNAWGEIFLHDADATNDLTVFLTASADQAGTGGGALWLRNDAGSTTISLEGGTSGDASVILPPSAINAAEMSNEPGVAHRASLPLNTYRAIPTGINALDSISINAPSAGYVLVFGALSAAISHTLSTEDEVYFQLMNTPSSIDYDQTGFALYRVPSVLPTSTSIATNYCQYLDLSRVFPVASAGTYKFYLNAQVQAGWDASDSFINAQLSAIFIPTLYGTVDVTNLANTGASSSNLKPFGDEPSYEVQSITVEEHNARVEAEVAKVKAELEARLQKLEQRFNKQDSGVEK